MGDYYLANESADHINKQLADYGWAVDTDASASNLLVFVDKSDPSKEVLRLWGEVDTPAHIPCIVIELDE